MPTKNVIETAVEKYTQRQTRQIVKRLLHTATRQNGDRLAGVAGAGAALRKTLDELRTIAPSTAHEFAISIGWGDRIPA